MSFPVVYHADYSPPLPKGHRFPMPKYRRVFELLCERGVINTNDVRTPTLAGRSMLLSAHTPQYVDAVLGMCLDDAAIRRLGLPLDEAILRRSLAAVGGTVHAAGVALEQGVACNLAGGSHHAHAAFGAGYCVFNDVAVAARTLLRTTSLQQMLIVDLDVHQGDGTASILSGEPGVFTFSMHAERNFPVRKQKSDCDIGLPDGTRDEAYLDILQRHLPVLLQRLQPQLVFYNAGVDPHAGDRLGRLQLSDEGLSLRDRIVIEQVCGSGAALVCVLGGGYDLDVDVVAERHLLLFTQLNRWQRSVETKVR